MSEEKIFRLKTFHGTKIFYDRARGIFHAAESDAAPIFIRLNDETAELFTVLDDRKLNFRFDGDNLIDVSEPTELPFVKNDDGSIAILDGDRFWSALENSDRFGMMPHNITWEHFTLEPADIPTIEQPTVEQPTIEQPTVEKPTVELFQLRTIHKTRVLYSSARKFHHVSTAAPDAQPIRARLEDNRLFLFVGDDDAQKYFSFDAKGNIVVSDKATPLNFVRNKDGSISIVYAKKFLSARQGTGAFDLRPKNLGWEHFTLAPLSDQTHGGGGRRRRKNLVRRFQTIDARAVRLAQKFVRKARSSCAKTPKGSCLRRSIKIFASIAGYAKRFVRSSIRKKIPRPISVTPLGSTTPTLERVLPRAAWLMRCRRR